MADSIRSLKLQVARLTKEAAAARQEVVDMRNALMKDTQSQNKSALEVQVGGDHYKIMGIQPIEYIFANNLGFVEGNIVKYASRWKSKGGIKDLEKIKHFVDLLIEEEKSQREFMQGETFADGTNMINHLEPAPDAPFTQMFRTAGSGRQKK